MKKKYIKITKSSINNIEGNSDLYRSPSYQTSQNYSYHAYNNIKVKKSRINMYKENYNNYINKSGTGNYKDEIDVSPIM